MNGLVSLYSDRVDVLLQISFLFAESLHIYVYSSWRVKSGFLEHGCLKSLLNSRNISGFVFYCIRELLLLIEHRCYYNESNA